ncbi:transposable element Tcb1 transposase [Trichonephila clavipes]|nr:transposable element Tcb1 transposase [Trichonephila clavipes]
MEAGWSARRVARQLGHSDCVVSHFSTRQCSALHGSFGTASWASHEFERTRGKVTANMKRNVSRHHTEFVCLNARSYRIVHSR